MLREQLFWAETCITSGQVGNSQKSASYTNWVVYLKGNMKASKIKDKIVNRRSIGIFSIYVEGEDIALSWDDEDADGNLDPHCVWVSLGDIAVALAAAEEEEPFSIEEDLVHGVVQILALGSWVY